MGLSQSIKKAMDDHKEKIAQPHFIFSAEAPKYPEKNSVDLGHQDVLDHLQGAGYDAHAINSQSPAPGILIYGVKPDVAEALHELVGRLGQESSIYSDGQNHEIRYHHGENEGKAFRGVGTEFYDQQPEGPHTSLPGGAGYFHHNLSDDFQKSECFKFYTEAKIEALLKAEDKTHHKVKQAIQDIAEPTEERRGVPRANAGAPPKIGVGVHDSYKQNANSSANVMWRAKVKGRKMLADNIPLHMTLKTFNDPNDVPHDEIRQKVNELGLERPDPKKLRYEPTIFHSQRDGKPYYMLKVHGTDPRYAQFYEHFKGRGITYPQFMGHVTIDKDLYDQIKREGIDHNDVEFSPLMVEHGANNPTHLFPDSKSHGDEKSDITPKKLNAIPGGEKGPIPFPQHEKHKKLAASEPDMDSLAKGLKHAVVGAVAAAAMTATTPSTANTSHEQSAMQQQSGYTSQKMLHAIEQVESTSGQNTNHKEVIGGLNSGDRAYGKYGLMPNTIRDTVAHNKDLKGRYGPLAALKGDVLHNFMHDNPGLEDTIAQKHLQRLEHHFGSDPQKIGYAWLNGVTGTYQAAKSKTDFANHWHVKKLLQALKGHSNEN